MTRTIQISLMALTFSISSYAQMEQGTFYGAGHFNMRAQDFNVTQGLEWSLTPQMGYHIRNMWSAGLIGTVGFQHVDSYSQNEAAGTSNASQKRGSWGGFGPLTRLHIGSEKASLFGEMSFQYGWFEQRSETSATQADESYYLQKGTYQQLNVGPGLALYFTPRIGAEFLLTYYWINAQRKSGTVFSDSEVENYNTQNIQDDGMEWKLGLVAFFGTPRSTPKTFEGKE
mgnify:CR=1 FL=1